MPALRPKLLINDALSPNEIFPPLDSKGGTQRA